MFDFLQAYPWALPLVIFFGRICDVTRGTLRIIFVGFFGVFIWVVVISQIFSHANDLTAYLAYAGGYATGNFVGILVENKIALGYFLIRIYTKKGSAALIHELNTNGFGSTHIRGEGAISEVSIIETVVSRKSERRVVNLVTTFDPNAFYVITDIRSKRKGFFSAAGAPRLGK